MTTSIPANESKDLNKQEEKACGCGGKAHDHEHEQGHQCCGGKRKETGNCGGHGGKQHGGCGCS